MVGASGDMSPCENLMERSKVVLKRQCHAEAQTKEVLTKPHAETQWLKFVRTVRKTFGWLCAKTLLAWTTSRYFPGKFPRRILESCFRTVLLCYFDRLFSGIEEQSKQASKHNKIINRIYEWIVIAVAWGDFMTPIVTDMMSSTRTDAHSLMAQQAVQGSVVRSWFGTLAGQLLYLVYSVYSSTSLIRASFLDVMWRKTALDERINANQVQSTHTCCVTQGWFFSFHAKQLR